MMSASRMFGAWQLADLCQRVQSLSVPETFGQACVLAPEMTRRYAALVRDLERAANEVHVKARS